MPKALPRGRRPISRRSSSPKNFVREWLMANGFQGREGEVVPEMSDEVVAQISERYMELYNQVTGEEFKAEPVTLEHLQQGLDDALGKLM